MPEEHINNRFVVNGSDGLTRLVMVPDKFYDPYSGIKREKGDYHIYKGPNSCLSCNEISLAFPIPGSEGKYEVVPVSKKHIISLKL